MSGIEIAGIVLGIFPVINFLIKKYDGRSLKKDLRMLQRNLEVEQAIFQNTLEGLLSAHVSDNKLRDLMSSPTSKAWEDQVLTMKLSYQLGERSFKAFQETLTDINEWLVVLKSGLDIEDKSKSGDGKSGKQRLKRLLKRLRRYADEKESFDELSRKVRQLKSLTENPCMHKREGGGTVSIALLAYRSLRNYASSIFLALSRKQTCKCTSHYANLRLDVSPSQNSIAQLPESSSISFRISFLIASKRDDTRLEWRDIKLTPFEECSSDEATTESKEQAPRNQKIVTFVVPDETRSRSTSPAIQSQVRPVSQPSIDVTPAFRTKTDGTPVPQANTVSQDSTTSQANTTITPTSQPSTEVSPDFPHGTESSSTSRPRAESSATSQPSTEVSSASQPDIEATPCSQSSSAEIRCLCRFLTDHRDANIDDKTLVGYLQDGNQGRFELYMIQAADNPTPCPSFSKWENLLRSRKRAPLNGSATKLTNLDRLKLALTLSSAVLQLDSTPWLPEPWIPGDFPHWRTVSSTEESASIEMFLSQELASQTVSEPDSILPSRSQSTNMMLNRKNVVIRNVTIFNLALILIELCFNRSIDDLAEPEEQAGTKDLTRFLTARRIVNSDKIREKRGKSYQDAVSYCLSPLKYETLENEDMQEEYLSEVIIPLQETCKHYGIVQ